MGRSTVYLMQIRQSAAGRGVSVLAISRLSFDLAKPHGQMMAALAEFERDRIRRRIRSGIAAAKARGKPLGRQPGPRPADREPRRLLVLAETEVNDRSAGRQAGLGRNSVGVIAKREWART